MPIMDDRSYYRLCSNAELREFAELRPTPELAVALAERLDNSETRTGGLFRVPTPPLGKEPLSRFLAIN